LTCLPFDDFQVDGDGLIRDVDARPPDAVRPDRPARGFQLVLGDRDPPPALRDLAHPTLRVIFRADFALDEEERAVDGNHIGGRVPERPSGNGREGGTFESWFTVRG
jgi:hypothetical protein